MKKESCEELSKRCKSLTTYNNLKIEIDRDKRLIKKFNDILKLDIKDQPTKKGLEEGIIESKNNILKNNQLLKQLKYEINCD